MVLDLAPSFEAGRLDMFMYISSILYNKNNSIIPPKICRNRQGQTNRNHEVWSPKDVAQGQGFDCQAKVNFEIIYPE